MNATSICNGLLLLSIPLFCPEVSRAIVLDDPANYEVNHTWSASSLGLPGPLGGLLFSPDGNTLYVVGASEQVDSTLYALPVQRDPVSHRVIGLGPANAVSSVFSGNPNTRGLDAGWEIGPSGTLFYTYWPAHLLAQRPGGFAGAETRFDMSAVNLPSSIAGLSFSPFLTDTNTGFAMLQCSTWQGADLYDILLTPTGGGLFQPLSVTRWVTLPRQGTGAIQYFPSGPLRGSILYVNWDYGEVMVLFIDHATGRAYDSATGLPTPDTANPITTRIAHDLGVGPWGLEFDPLTLDFFVATWGGDPANTIIQIGQTGLPTSLQSRVTGFVQEGAQCRLRWYGPPGWTHRILRSPDLTAGSWQEIQAVTNAPFVNEKLVPAPGQTNSFFRLYCTQP